MFSVIEPDYYHIFAGGAGPLDYTFSAQSAIFRAGRSGLVGRSVRLGRERRSFGRESAANHPLRHGENRGGQPPSAHHSPRGRCLFRFQQRRKVACSNEELGHTGRRGHGSYRDRRGGKVSAPASMGNGQRNFTVKGMTLYDGDDYHYFGSGIWIYFDSKCKIVDVEIDKAEGSNIPSAFVAQFSDVYVKNLVIHHCRGNNPFCISSSKFNGENIRIWHQSASGVSTRREFYHLQLRLHAIWRSRDQEFPGVQLFSELPRRYRRCRRRHLYESHPSSTQPLPIPIR